MIRRFYLMWVDGSPVVVVMYSLLISD
jgi:hypothetical protein